MSFKPQECFDWAWLDGRFVPYADAKIPLGAHGLHYATSCFEGIRAYRHVANGRLCVWMLSEHVARMFQSAKQACLELPYSSAELGRAILEVASLNDNGQDETLYIRPVAFMNVDPETGKGIGVDPGNAQVSIGIMTQPWRKYLAAGMYHGGATVWISDRARLRPEQARTRKQASAYGITSVPAKLAAKQRGATEALCVDLQGRILDGTGQTLFAIIGRNTHNSVILTPDPEDGNILAGTTADFMFSRLRREHRTFRVVHVPGFTLRMLRSEVDGLGFLGTATEVMPITRVMCGDDESFDVGPGFPHELVTAMQEIYLSAVHGHDAVYERHIHIPPTRDEVLERHGLATTA